MWNEILVAVALVLILEGIIPFLSPDKFRQAMVRFIQMPDQVLRMIGLASMTVGMVFLYILRILN